MNESLYRIVFNKARGCMMAVSELASSHSSGKDKNLSAATRAFGRSQSQFHSSNPSGSVFDDSFGKPKPVVKAINVVVLFSMLLSSLSAPLSAYAQIRSDANAPEQLMPYHSEHRQRIAASQYSNTQCGWCIAQPVQPV